MRARACLLVCTLSLAACGTLRDRPPAPIGDKPPAPSVEPWLRELSVQPVTDNERLLAYFDWIQRLAAPELARERETARRALSAEASDAHRLRYALALTASGGAAEGGAKALDILEPVARNRASPQHALALMLRTLLGELRRAETEQAELKRKLDSLKALEKSMSGRGGAEK